MYAYYNPRVSRNNKKKHISCFQIFRVFQCVSLQCLRTWFEDYVYLIHVTKERDHILCHLLLILYFVVSYTVVSFTVGFVSYTVDLCHILLKLCLLLLIMSFTVDYVIYCRNRACLNVRQVSHFRPDFDLAFVQMLKSFRSRKTSLLF